MNPKPVRKIIIQEIGRMILALVLFTLGLVIAVGLIFNSLWSLFFCGPIYLLIVIGYLDSSIHSMYEQLVSNRKDYIHKNFPHLSVGINVEVIKECKAFLKIPDSEWARREKDIVDYEEEQKRRKEQIETDYCELERIAPNGIEKWMGKNGLRAPWREENREDYNKYLRELIHRPILPYGMYKPQWADKRSIIAHRDEIIQLEDIFRKSQCDKSWLSAQKQFSKEIVTLIKKEFSFLGRYVYSAPVKLVNEEGNVSESSLSIWQLFFHSYCLDEQLDYTHFPEEIQLKKYLLGDCSAWTSQSIRIYPRIIEAVLKALKEKYEDLAVIVYNDNLVKQLIEEIFRDNEIENGTSLLAEQDKLYARTIVSLGALFDEEHIPSYDNSDLGNSDIQNKKLIIITNHTATSEIINFTQQLWEHYPESRPCISFLSLFKEFSTEEMQALIDKKNKAIAEEEEKKRKEQELIDSIPSKVDKWESLSSYDNFKIKYLLDYYPTTVEFEADDDEWDDRWTVWNFKNDPEKTPEKAHRRVLDRGIPEFAGILKDTFGEESLKYLTLVCIPASTQIKNDARYKEFSGRLCQETGMENGFDYTHVTVSREARHNGGEEGVVNYSFDDSFFNGKRVILLDDIITKGNSMRIAKAKLEKLGAQVICGLSVGKTRHERRNGRPDMDEE